jgi:dihydroxyacetone kinase-like predicted kinase
VADVQRSLEQQREYDAARRLTVDPEDQTADYEVETLMRTAARPTDDRLREALRRLVDSAVLVPMDAEDAGDPSEVWCVHPEPLEIARAALRDTP